MNFKKTGTFRCIVLIVLLTFFVSNGYAQEKSDAAKYMDSLSQGSEKIKPDTWEYIRTFAHSKDVKEINAKRSALLKSISKAISDVKKVPPYNGNSEFRDSVLKYLTTLNAIMNQDYADLVDMEQIAEESYDKMEAFFKAREKANEKLESAFTELSLAQQKFATANNITLISVQDELSAKIEKSSAVSDYHDKIYLIFFKSYKQELYLLDAISKQDINAIEQNSDSLYKYSKEGIELIKKIKPYEKDNSLSVSCIKILEFYNKESQKSVPLIVDYLLKNESYQKVKSAFDLKKDDERTKEDVDLYNKKVKELNDAVKSYNTDNDATNKERALLINNWNKSSSAFFDNHIPK
ncbi:MAG: hypothetical protein JW982_06230 [Spirochaetes bacterium]|nr:hypothetical protein [Spirochaetota bacterium]